MGCWVSFSSAGNWGGSKSVNPWDIGCPDLASGGREDGLATTDHLRKHEEREREKDGVMEMWRKRRE